MSRPEVDTSEVDTGVSTEVDDGRSATPCRASFRHGGQTVTVTMTSPHVPPNVVPLVPTCWPVFAVDRPTLVTGWIQSATFRVDGLGVAVNFTTGTAYRDDGIAFVVLESVTVVPNVPTTDVHLPLSRLLRAAVKASGVRGIRVPSGEWWTWDVWDDPTSYRLADDTSSRRGKQDSPSDPCFTVYVGPITAAEESRLNVKAITGTGRATRTTLTDDVLREVADVYYANPRRTIRAIAQHFGIANVTVTKWVKKARERGFIDALPTTDKRRKGT